MRLFVAIDIPGEIRAKVAQVVGKLQETGADVRWVAQENLHVTVKFLGEVAESRVPGLLGRVIRAAGEVPSFSLEFEGIDRLPQKGPVRVIMSRIISPDQRITRLHRLVDSGIGGMGLPMDTRVLVPHLTLGRVSSNRGINRLLRMVEKHDLDYFGAFVAESVTVYRSELGAGAGGGSRYVSIGEAQVGGTAQRAAP